MQIPGTFSQEDLDKYIDALNFIATETTFGSEAPKIAYIIKARNHFSFLQSLAPKIEANIAELLKKNDFAKKSCIYTFWKMRRSIY
jgi:hypothetical protein